MNKKFKKKCKYIKCKKIFTTNKINKLFCSVKCRKDNEFLKYQNAKKGILKGVDNNSYNFLKLRFEVFKRDNFNCKYCGRNSKDNVKLVVDHIFPKSKGGEDIFDNLITSCEDCNLGKGDVLLSRRSMEKEDRKVKIKPLKCVICNKNEGIYLFEKKLICSDCLDKTF